MLSRQIYLLDPPPCTRVLALLTVISPWLPVEYILIRCHDATNYTLYTVSVCSTTNKQEYTYVHVQEQCSCDQLTRLLAKYSKLVLVPVQAHNYIHTHTCTCTLYIRPYKITYLILIHLFPKKKNWGGRRHFIFIFTHQDTSKSSIWSICTRYLVKGHYYMYARAIAIKFVEAASKNWDRRGWKSSTCKLLYMA